MQSIEQQTAPDRSADHAAGATNDGNPHVLTPPTNTLTRLCCGAAWHGANVVIHAPKIFTHKLMVVLPMLQAPHVNIMFPVCGCYAYHVRFPRRYDTFYAVLHINEVWAD